MKWICRPEQDHLRRMCCRCEMHGSRIDCDEQLRLANQRRQRQQVCLPSQVGNFVPHALRNCRDVRLLIGGWPTRQNKLEFAVLAEVVN